MRRLHIGHFLSHYPQPGGTTTAVRGLSDALARLGHQITIYSCGERTPTPEREPERPHDLQTLRFECKSRNPFRVPVQLRARLRSNEDRIDLLILHGMFNPRNIAVAHAARRAGIPYVVCPHGPYHPALFDKNRASKLVYGMLFERPLLNAAAAIQVLADDHRKLLADYGVRVPGFVVPNGFDPAEAPLFDSGGAAPGAGHPNNGPEFLYLGRIEMHIKGLDLLLQALALGVRQRKLPTTVRLHLVGPDWGDQNTLVRLADRLRIADNTRFPGPSSDKPWSAIASYGVVVLPSRCEGFGLTILEAMIAAKPVIVSEAAGVSRWVRQARCGFLVQPSVESICAGLICALESRNAWHLLGERGRRFAYDNLTWEEIARKASESYQRLVMETKIAPGGCKICRKVLSREV